MGVHGLWNLIQSAGRPIPVETLEYKVLAVDISIWLHQLNKGLRASGGEKLTNAHLIGLFNRICKLLYYRIKPVFVFDGTVVQLKRETIEQRRKRKLKHDKTLENLKERLLQNLMKENAIGQLLTGSSNFLELKALSNVQEDIFNLPALPANEEEETSEEEEDKDIRSAKVQSLCEHECGLDIHSIDVKSDKFKSLTPELRYDILSELIETRKQNSWGRVHEMPEEPSEFSNYQLQRLLKRRAVQVSMDEAAREIGKKKTNLSDLRKIFEDNEIKSDELKDSRIASDDVTRYVYISDNTQKVQSSEMKNNDLSCENEENSAGPSKDYNLIENSSEEDDPSEIPSKDFRNSHSVEIFQNDLEELEKEKELISNELANKDAPKIEELEPLLSASSYFHMSPRTDDLPKHSVNLPDSKVNKDQMSRKELLKLLQERVKVQKEMVDKLNLDEEKSKIGKLEKERSDDLPGPSRNCYMPDDKDSESIDLLATFRVDNDGISQEELLKLIIKESDVSHRKQSTDLNDSHKIKICDRKSLSDHPGPKETIGITDMKIDEDKSESDEDSEDGFIEVESTKETMEDVVENDIFSDVFQTDSDHQMLENILKNQSNVLTVQIDDARKLEVVEKSKIQEETGVIEIKNKVAPIPIVHMERESDHSIVEQSKILDFREEKSNLEPVFRDVDLVNIGNSLQEEREKLMAEKYKQERLSTNVTDQMLAEIKDLLQLFGVPWVVAPTEAESQCAYLENINLTSGTITDDSDIWLFGGTNVYKNFFDNKKFVKHFRMIDLESKFKLSRDKLIQFALLVGSDYTTGIEGVGPVTALEIIAHFHKSGKLDVDDVLKPLESFREWISSDKDTHLSFAKKLKRKKNDLTHGFPSRNVVNAYLHPIVDDSAEKFSWSYPDIDKLVYYTKLRFGWDKKKSQEIIMPILTRLEKGERQGKISSYFSFLPTLPTKSSTVSQRVAHAVETMGGHNPCTKTQDKKYHSNSKVKLGKRKEKVEKVERNDDSADKVEKIPQREKSRIEAAKRRKLAAKILKKCKKRIVKNKLELSESDSESASSANE